MWIYTVIGTLARWAAAKMLYNLSWERYERRLEKKPPSTPQEIRKAAEALMHRYFYDTGWHALFVFGLLVLGLWVWLNLAVLLIPTLSNVGFALGAVVAFGLCCALYKLVEAGVRRRVQDSLAARTREER